MENNNSIMKLAAQCKAVRKNNKLTQQELADRIGCSRKTISDFENGSSATRIDTVIQICNALGLSIEISLGDSKIDTDLFIDCSSLNAKGRKKVETYIKDIKPAYGIDK